MNRYRPAPPTKAQQRLSVQMIAVQRDKPLDPHSLASIARAHGMSTAEVEQLFAEEAQRKAASA